MKVVEFLAAIAVGITAVRIYLQVSRLWKRKHEKVVTDSISVTASLMSIFVYIPFTAKFIFIDRSIAPALNSIIILAGFTVTFLVASGVWVTKTETAAQLKIGDTANLGVLERIPSNAAQPIRNEG
jgi:hypothetical protein